MGKVARATRDFSVGTAYDGATNHWIDENGSTGGFVYSGGVCLRVGSEQMIALWNQNIFAADQYSQAKFNSTGGTDSRGLAVKATLSGAGATHYDAVYEDGGWTLYYRDTTVSGLPATGAGDVALATAATPDPSAGDLIELRCVSNGSNWVLTITNLTTAAQVLTFTDTTGAAGASRIGLGVVGRPGIMGEYSHQQSRTALDDWEGGDITGSPRRIRGRMRNVIRH